MIEKVVMGSPLGNIAITGDAQGLNSIVFTDETVNSETSNLELKKAIFQLEEYFDGRLTDFDLRLNPGGTKFQKKVWQQLAAVSFGKTCSYSAIAAQLGDPKVIRAAASANAKNPLLIVTPCHRIIGKNDALTGFSGGLWRKKWLLEHEQNSRQIRLF